MTMDILFLLLLTCTSFWDISDSLTASFYGNSYLEVPIEEARSDTDVRLHFRTYRPNGLLLLAAGETDFCVMELEAGHVVVRIDLGSGEAILRSPPGMVFNDLKWHRVHLTRSQARVVLSLDEGMYTSEVTTPGRFYELNINEGIFLGSTHATDVFFGNFVPYRGCLEEVTYNGIDVFHQSRTMYDYEPLYHQGVTWDCSPEFAAASDQPISFLTNTSFIAFPGLESRQEVVQLNFDVRTRSEYCLLLFHTGKAYNSDFIVVEVVNGDLVLTINIGNGAMEFVSSEYIADGRWHQVEIVIDPRHVRLGIDGIRKSRPINTGRNSFLDLDGYMYVGGLDVATRAKAMEYRLSSITGENAGAGSLVGCILNFKINGEMYGFREAEITSDLHPECLWSFPCTSDPCIPGAVCTEEGYYHYQCVCELDNCFKDAENGGISQETPVLSMLHVQDVVVREGESAVISSSNIELLPDYRAHNIQDRSVLFKVVTFPEHGSIIFSDGRSFPEFDGVSFTQNDLMNNRVKFVHDDTETTEDMIGLELEFTGSHRNLPVKYQDTYSFTLMVHVVPRNDPPQLSLPSADVLVIVQNTYLVITPELMRAEDKDDRPEFLEYSIQYQQGYDVGYFEIRDMLGVRARIHSFTQQDINEGKIKFVHRGANVQQFRIQVSDGKDISDPRMLNVNAVPLKLSKQSNTGLDVFSSTVTPLTSTNLTYQTNAPNQLIDIRYDVTDPPYYGLLERQQHSTGIWFPSTVFTQDDVREGRVRYFHNSSSGRPENDYFRYRVHSMDVTTQEYEFFIRITPIKADLVRNKELVMLGAKEQGITSDHLRGVSTVESHSSRDVFYSIVDAPDQGDVIIIDGYAKVKLTEGMNFTQRDVDAHRIVYRLRRTPSETVQDAFRFRLVIPGDVSDMHTFAVEYQPSTTETQRINSLLQGVREGGRALISKNDLYIETPASREYRYSVTMHLMHGELQFVNPASGEVIASNVTVFANSDIRAKRLYYKHDDSESKEDKFGFTAIPLSDVAPTNNNTFSDRFEIQIMPENDNPPERVVYNVINVVRNRGKVLSTTDIKYMDPDLDFDSRDLIYTKDSIENGDLVLADDHSFSLYNFTQGELELGHIYFKHSGPRYGRSVLRITDGKFVVNGTLEVRASEPYIQILNNTGLEVVKGMSVPITPKNLSLESNLNAADKEKTFQILATPAHGALVQANNGRPKTSFTMKDLKNKRIIYSHDGSNHLQDSFLFKARIFQSEVEGEVMIKVLLDSTTISPPEIVDNKPLVLDELGRATINRHLLRVEHEGTQENEIIFTIKRFPVYGNLVLKGTQGREFDTFTQEDITKRRLLYHHSEIGSNSDMFSFDVTNGDLTVGDNVFHIHIVPYMIPLITQNFTLPEGERQVINTAILNVTDPHFLQQELQYVIVKAPQSGWLVDSENTRIELIQFSQLQLDNEQIYYKHDGNDTLSDEFSVMVKSTVSKKQSYPVTAHVTVVPENDQAPKIVVNERLEVWRGAKANLTRAHLLAHDMDSEPAQLLYTVTTPTNGELKLKGFMDSSVTNFTQQQINDEQVIFEHTGGMAGEFHFQVSDGTNQDRRRTFVITATPLRLHLQNDHTLQVFPGVQQPIRSRHLLTSANDANYTNYIIYTLNSRPAYGEIVSVKGGSLFAVNSFTQDEINGGSIAYKHFSNMERHHQYDIFNFDVSAPFADSSIKYEQFEITTAFENINPDNVDQLLEMVPVNVEEGGQFNFTRSNLDSDSLKRHLFESGLASDFVYSFIVHTPPMHGKLTLREKNVTNGTIFTQGAIDGGELGYKHDNSETLWDVFYYQVQIQYTNEAGDTIKIIANNTIPFNITILPINDKSFYLETRFPSMRMVQGFIGKITKHNLSTGDPDTGPEGLQYHIADGPTGGHLAFIEDPAIHITSFTQQDINEGRLVFVQNGEIRDSGFYFSVDDGHHNPYYKAFNIPVDALYLRVSKIHQLIIMQGQVSVFLKPGHFEIETNGDINKVMVNISRAPMHGYLYHNFRPALTFSYLDLKDGRLNYVQTDLSRSSDSFEFTLYDKYNHIPGRQMNIRVLPLIKSTAETPFKVKPGESALLTTDYLDASELMEFSNSMPTYYIEPGSSRHGKLVKIVQTRDKRDTNDRSVVIEQRVESFTHQDIADRVIKYEASDKVTYKDLKDGFSYTLRADNVQPAPGMFHITLPATHEPTKPPPVVTQPTKKPNEPEKDPSLGEAGTASGMRIDTLTIVIVIVAVTLGLLIIFIIYKCCKRKSRYSIEKQRELEADEEERKALKSMDPHHSPLAPPNVYTDPYRGGSRDEGDDVISGHRSPRGRYDPHAAVPVVITNDDDYQRHTSHSPSMGSISYDAQTRIAPYRASPHHHEPVHTSLDRSDYGSGSAHHSPDLDQMLESRSLDSHSDMGRGVPPTCKVTPIGDSRDSMQHVGRDERPGSGATTGSQPRVDWQSMDPELLQHYRKTNPVLHKTKHWV